MVLIKNMLHLKMRKKKIVAKDLISNFPNAIYLGTFSKAYALGE